jgi:leucyl-tRNA synthetase
MNEDVTNTAPFRYDATLAGDIEAKWQAFWEENATFTTPNPPDVSSEKQPYVVMDMFPYPSGAGLHVGHPLGYIATDVMARFHRMNGKNVLHALGYDAFGLPAEQYAIQTGQHPRITTQENISNMREQLKMLGLGHDPSRTFATIDPEYVRWTQWIFSKMFDSYYDEDADKARPIAELVAKFEAGGVPGGVLEQAGIALEGDADDKARENASPSETVGADARTPWETLTPKQQADILNEFRLAYVSTSPVNWSPGLGTVLANEEVTAEGKSERGNFPVFQRNLRQWSMRITAYANRLDEDLQMIDWPQKVKLMQTNWIGKSRGAYIDFPLDSKGVVTENSTSSTNNASEKAQETLRSVKVFTTRPDTIRGATFMVVAPEHPVVALTKQDQKASVQEYVRVAKNKSAIERQQDAGKKTGVFTGLYCENPATKKLLPVYVADYVLMGYGTGAIMAVPADDTRDEEFANTYSIDIDKDYQKFDTIESAIAELERLGVGEATTTFRLRDWLFSRQRYWGEPFPIVYDQDGIAHLLPDNSLPVTLPEVPDYKPKTYDPDDEHSEPESPLGRNEQWKKVSLDLGDGKGLREFTRETNTMPNWAGSCWYYLRYLNASWADSSSDSKIVDPKLDDYWLAPEHNPAVGKSGGVDLYVGGVEHAVLHLLYARFWHKVLYDLGYVSSPEPFHKLFNQGYVQAFAYTDSRGQYVPAEEVVEVAKTGGGKDGSEPQFEYNGEKVTREYGKMGKSLKNVVTPDEMAKQFGADTFRIYEMSMGPLDLSRPWETRAVVGAQRYLQRLWRLAVDEATGENAFSEESLSVETLKEMNQCIEAVRVEMSEMRPNTALSKLIVYVNYLTKLKGEAGSVPRAALEPLVIMTSPLAPHIAEELWSRLGHVGTITYTDFPKADEKYLGQDTVKIGVQVNGKVRATLEISANATKDEFEREALGLERIKEVIGGKTIRKAIVVPGKIVNFVI